jgi:transglutaminase-like putative cysteine protease
MCRRFSAVAVCVLLTSGWLGAAQGADADATGNVRRFRLEYGATLLDLPPGQQVCVWIPVPTSNDHQQVSEISRDLPEQARLGVESRFGNQMLYFQTRAPQSGQLTFQLVWDVERKEVHALRRAGAKPLSPGEREKYLAAERRVPVGDPKPLALLRGTPLPDSPLELARVLYDKVDAHVKYDKSRPGYGNGDVLWVCDSRFGNCTDFHSLFISLARSKGLPSYFAIGFPLPPDQTDGEIAGYHCWAFFHEPDYGWVPVDISEADKFPEMKEYYFGNLTADRVEFTIGRDLELVPRQQGEPLNYFIYPYVEVDGKPHTAMEKRFRFRDRP